MNDPHSWAFLRFVAWVFLVGGATLAVVGIARPSLRRRLFVMWLGEGVEVGAVLGPALFGGPVTALGYALMALASSRELTKVARGPLAVVGCAIIVLGFASMAVLAGSHLPVFLWGFAVIELNDTAAWAFGSAFGRHPLWTRISPNKTWEGWTAGLFVALLVGHGLRGMVADWSDARVWACGATLACVATAGDLAASAIKRAAGVKDFGAVLPHRGGVLDVYDSMVLAAPVLYAMARA